MRNSELFYTKHHLKFSPVFYWCLVLVPFIYSEAPNSVGSDYISDRWQHTKLRQFSVGDGFLSRIASAIFNTIIHKENTPVFVG